MVPVRVLVSSGELLCKCKLVSREISREGKLAIYLKHLFFYRASPLFLRVIS